MVRQKTIVRNINDVKFHFTLSKSKYVNIDNEISWISRWYWGVIGDYISHTTLHSSAIRKSLPYAIKASNNQNRRDLS